MYFLHVNGEKGILYGENGRTRIADNTLVALTPMIAESRTEEKDVMVNLKTRKTYRSFWSLSFSLIKNIINLCDFNKCGS